MDIMRDIQSLSVFKQNASRLVKQLRETKEPMVLTVNGQPAVVVQDAESYQKLLDAKEYAETVAVLRERIADLENSSDWPTAEEVSKRLTKKYGLKSTDR
jgi:prevent-host-death family protein